MLRRYPAHRARKRRGRRPPGATGARGPSGPPRPGEALALEVLGSGRVAGVVEGVEELVQEGVRGLAWRVTLRLPDGSTAHGIVRGRARMAFLDPRHRLA